MRAHRSLTGEAVASASLRHAAPFSGTTQCTSAAEKTRESVSTAVRCGPIVTGDSPPTFAAITATSATMTPWSWAAGAGSGTMSLEYIVISWQEKPRSRRPRCRPHKMACNTD